MVLGQARTIGSYDDPWRMGRVAADASLQNHRDERRRRKKMGLTRVRVLLTEKTVRDTVLDAISYCII